MTHRLAIKALLGASIALALSLSAQAATPQGPANTRFDISSLAPGGQYDRFIVTYRDGSTERSNRAVMLQNVGAAISRAGLDHASVAGRNAGVQAAFQRKLATGADLIRTSRKLGSSEAAALVRQIAADPAVAYVTPDVMLHRVRDIRAPDSLKPATFTPSDSYYPIYQWHLKAPDGSITYFGDANHGGARVNDAWDLADGTGIVIAVLDTGITRHVDVDTSYADAGYDFITDAFVSGRATDGRVPGGWDLGDWTTTEPWLSECTDADNPPEDSSWHGTHVAGTAGAELTDNGIGMAGVAFDAKVLPVRVLGHCGGYTSDIADAIIWAAGGHVDGVPRNQHPAQVINLSLGGAGRCNPHDVTAKAVAEANSLGAVVVVSAGNSGDDAAKYTPAGCPGVITVASTGITSQRAYYSNWGHAVEIAAPGGGIYQDDDPNTGVVSYDGFVWQALNNSATTPVPLGTTYGGFAGTSQAAPHVTGTVALMQSARKALGLPLLKPGQVLRVLEKTAYEPMIRAKGRYSIGAGIVDSAAAVEAAVDFVPHGKGRGR
ncbi:S8 family peptidase [Frateuria hangzhouensis]|uniref:S8 family peptidase n=1 Tax=Frateuria hangzhouensis TaxID=2995589 RepID=UPI002260EAC8|nr:S8 family peptidase [Frateuria sp. STR12]MCX7514723.1 S8 family peptidase [Frateuria sp. STR12]